MLLFIVGVLVSALDPISLALTAGVAFGALEIQKQQLRAMFILVGLVTITLAFAALAEMAGQHEGMSGRGLNAYSLARSATARALQIAIFIWIIRAWRRRRAT